MPSWYLFPTWVLGISGLLADAEMAEDIAQDVLYAYLARDGAQVLHHGAAMEGGEILREAIAEGLHQVPQLLVGL